MIDDNAKMYLKCYRDHLIRHAQDETERELVARCMDRLLNDDVEGLEQEILDTITETATPIQCLLLCMVYFIKERYGSGYEMVAKALAINPDFVPAMNIYAEVKILDKNYLEAIVTLQKSIRFDPDQFQARHLLGEIFRDSRQYERALQVLDPLRETTPENSDLWVWLRECHKAVGTLSLFENHLLDAVEANPECFVVWFHLGYHYADISRLEDALRAFRRADMLSPKDASILSNMGQTYQRMGNLEAAIQLYRRATRLRPDHAISWMNLASALFLLERENEEYQDALRRVAELNPDIMKRATFYRIDDGVAVDSTYRGEG